MRQQSVVAEADTQPTCNPMERHAECQSRPRKGAGQEGQQCPDMNGQHPEDDRPVNRPTCVP